MIKIEFIPLEGINIDFNKQIRFGITKSELIQHIGNPSNEFGNELYFDEFELHIDIDENGRVEFIESIMGPYPEKTEVSINGINPFETKASDLVQILGEFNNGKVDKSEAEYAFTFIDKSIGIYRSATTKDVEEMIKEMKDNNDFENNKEDALFELQKSQFFWTFGIGTKGYYEYLLEK